MAWRGQAERGKKDRADRRREASGLSRDDVAFALDQRQSAQSSPRLSQIGPPAAAGRAGHSHTRGVILPVRLTPVCLPGVCMHACVARLSVPEWPVQMAGPAIDAAQPIRWRQEAEWPHGHTQQMTERRLTGRPTGLPAQGQSVRRGGGERARGQTARRTPARPASRACLKHNSAPTRAITGPHERSCRGSPRAGGSQSCPQGRRALRPSTPSASLHLRSYGRRVSPHHTLTPHTHTPVVPPRGHANAGCV
ncbi:unnamed protein product [Protopolystoma xenopodis]|uniref:Uncharacterized protein n=1 Tax=Protopolystoma xenopodis TaxID=117903 RepID=A0A448WNV3_9PLAT|nr:unnamed protein product [Protopolystoma xenopodis]